MNDEREEGENDGGRMTENKEEERARENAGAR